ncbi:MAG: nucleotidyl transferase AbiEii/AbiGii toxin family protein [Leptospira sp.]|nr:nucleotidyl transferase AbiEii/AbiGii toxin family protein [Leptospira sp.]
MHLLRPGFEINYQLTPIPYSVRLYDKPSLFAGKLHAVLCRNWKTRVKGRDFYDYIWYLSKGISPNILYLESRMIQSGHLHKSEKLNRELLFDKLQDRFVSVDFVQAKSDILSFINDSSELDLWSSEFFWSITKDRLIV